MRPAWETPEDSELSAFVHRLRPRIGAESDGLVLGVGVFSAPEPRPLLLVNARWPELAEFAETRTPWFSFGDELRGPGGPERLPGVAGEILLSFDPPPNTAVIVVEPPEPMGGPIQRTSLGGIPIRSAMRGTLGPHVHTRRDGSHVYLTAGHVVDGPGSVVERVEVKRFIPTRYSSIGRVLAKSQPQPAGPAEYDVALVSVEGRHSGIPCRVAGLDPVQRHPLPVALTGGVSGRGFGMVIGALDSYSDAAGRLTWKNSWLVAPGAIGTDGDSGASVELDGGDVLGILVDGSRVRGGRAFALLYVQDLQAAMADRLAAQIEEVDAAEV